MKKNTINFIEITNAEWFNEIVKFIKESKVDKFSNKTEFAKAMYKYFDNDKRFSVTETVSLSDFCEMMSKDENYKEAINSISYNEFGKIISGLFKKDPNTNNTDYNNMMNALIYLSLCVSDFNTKEKLSTLGVLNAA